MIECLSGSKDSQVVGFDEKGESPVAMSLLLVRRQVLKVAIHNLARSQVQESEVHRIIARWPQSETELWVALHVMFVLPPSGKAPKVEVASQYLDMLKMCVR